MRRAHGRTGPAVLEKVPITVPIRRTCVSDTLAEDHRSFGFAYLSPALVGATS